MSNVPPRLTEAAPVARRIGEALAFEGYAWGMRQPSLQYAVHTDKANEQALLALDDIFSGLLRPDLSAPLQERSSDTVVNRLLLWPSAILRAGSHIVCQPARASVSRHAAGNVYMIQQPCVHHTAAANTVNFVLWAINLLAAGPRISEARSNISGKLSPLLRGLKRTGLRGFNSIWFLNAADELGVPWAHVTADVFLFGWGAKGHWLQSSSTDETSKIGTLLARNKLDAAAVLRTLGAPVPEHVAVHSEQEAIGAAEKIGYPVVVKPIDLDGGRGVCVNLRTAAAVREAYASAAALSKLILVERHIDGRDFRIQVVRGVVHGVLERVPGGVTGNGVDSVKALLDRQNLERKRASDDRRFLHEIANDKEASDLLSEQDLRWDSVPAVGRFVRLRSASNVASGGVPMPIPLDQVHADNLALAVRAARLLRLDVAGVDLLIPDIARSWLEGGAAICEVNAQPQMFTTMHKPMLASLLGGTDGRIPVAIIVGAQAAAEGSGIAVHRELLAAGLNAGLVCASEVHVGRQLVCDDAAGAFAGARMLCHDRNVEAMVICVSDKGILAQGWPVDRCDVLVLDTRPPLAADSAPMDMLDWLGFSAHLSPRRVIVDESDPALLAKAKAVFGAAATVESAALGKALLLGASVADSMMAPRERPNP